MLRRLLYGKLAYPAYHALKGDGILRASKELTETQWLPPEELHARQKEKLAKLLRFAGEHVPYYRQLFHELGCSPESFAEPEPFRRLPLLTKETIRAQGKQLYADEQAGRTFRHNSTSGSTGEPLKFLTDSSAHYYRLADELRGKSWTGFQLGEKEVALWGAPIEIQRSKRWRGRVHALITGHRLLSSFELSVDRMEHYIHTIQRFSPRLMVAYPSALEAFARHCLQRNAQLPSLTYGIIASAETLWDHQKSLFKEAFGTPVYNRYGSREVGAVAHECPVGMGLHVSADRLLVEIIDDYGRPCPPGVWGDVVVTDLESFAMPLVRYSVADRATWASDDVCQCGRGLPLLAGVEGRTMDVVRAPDGRSVGGTFWTLLLRSRPGFRQFQVIQDEAGGITVRYVPEPGGVDSELIEYFRRQVRLRLGEEVVLRFEATERIDRTQSGKHRLIVSHFQNDAAVREARV